jgi:hypothetical protein
VSYDADGCRTMTDKRSLHIGLQRTAERLFRKDEKAAERRV